MNTSVSDVEEKFNKMKISKKKPREKQWKGKFYKYSGLKKISDLDKRFKINLELVKSGEDKRTTIMIKNIPNKYTQKMLLKEVNKEFKEWFDVLYLPIDFETMANSGYAFINFLNYKDIEMFYERFDDK